MKFSVRFFSSLYISLLCATASSSVSAIQTNKSERWFEIEVILFKQLNDKNILKEQFPDNVNASNLPEHNKHFDLLTPYLQPNLAHIKQFIPQCIDKSSDTLLGSMARISNPFSDGLKAIEHINVFNMPKLTLQDEAVTHQELVFDLQKEALSSPLYSTENICVIGPKDIKAIFSDEQLASIKFDSVNVEAVPTKLNALGEHIYSHPYLIANDSLRLADIRKRLHWSKEFQPLLHFGWRQVGVTKNKAIPLKLFAGEHLDYQYQQAINAQQLALDNTKAVDQLALLKGQEGTSLQATQDETKQQKLKQLFNEIESKESINISNLIDEFEQQKFKELLTINETNIEESEPSNLAMAPVKPLQPWFLDGFLKVHLDHYLYITADFNVLSQSSNKNKGSTATENKLKLINFSQSKRAITGEVHYFDHPYVGMIVQIRRFDPSKPKGEAVTQVIK